MHSSSPQSCSTHIRNTASALGTFSNMSPPTYSILSGVGTDAFDTTWGRSKLIPRIQGKALTSIDKVVPSPPPTSTTVLTPSNKLGHPLISWGTATLASQAMASLMSLL
uniref:Uncharacterized protein n=1 Tax=Opuntia streptacantha TaxID=393608 RepID=A0A7C8Z368_OPUST